MPKASKTSRKRGSRSRSGSAGRAKSQKTKALQPTAAHAEAYRAIVDPHVEQQMKIYEEAMQALQQQKFLKAKQLLDKVIAGPSKELADRALMHLRIADQRLSRVQAAAPRTPEEHYQGGVAMMNLGRWDEARESLLRAKKLAPKADYVFYAMAALDCLTGEAESAMENLKVAIQLRPENRYHARNDEDFAFLQEDPRFTELLYPECDGSGS
jgi:tetratricopeptide (TPR) repeat protein